MEISSLQCSFGCDTPLRIVGEQVIHQLQAGLGKKIEFLLQVIVGLLFECERIEERQVHYARPDLIVWRAEQFDDQVQLFDLGLARKDRFIGEQLTENASAGPLNGKNSSHLNCSLF